MENRPKKRMIGRIAKDEKIIVNMITEDLQDAYEAYHQNCEREKRVIEDFHEDVNNEEKAKAAFIARFNLEKLRYDWWTTIHTRYGYWNHNIGLRDGYALVSMGKAESMGGGLDFLKKKLMDLMGGEASDIE